VHQFLDVPILVIRNPALLLIAMWCIVEIVAVVAVAWMVVAWLLLMTCCCGFLDWFVSKNEEGTLGI
jgi:hypothetical protein